MSKECAICRTDMEILSFETPPEDLSDDICVNETCLRLKCGHAFHSSCIALSFRNTAKCPLCRDEPDETWLPLDANNEILNWSNFDALVTVSTDRLREIEDSISIIERVRQCNAKVQKARAQFNREKVKAFELVQRLEAKRKDALNGAIANFRRENRLTWERTRKTLQRNMRKIRKVEYEAMEQIVGATEAKKNLETLDHTNMYDLRRIMSHAEPFRKRFWVR